MRGCGTAVAESLPGYRLSKFQPLMPPWVEREVVARYLLDIAGSAEWLAEPESLAVLSFPTAHHSTRHGPTPTAPTPGEKDAD